MRQFLLLVLLTVSSIGCVAAADYRSDGVPIALSPALNLEGGFAVDLTPSVGNGIANYVIDWDATELGDLIIGDGIADVISWTFNVSGVDVGLAFGGVGNAVQTTNVTRLVAASPTQSTAAFDGSLLSYGGLAIAKRGYFGDRVVVGNNPSTSVFGFGYKATTSSDDSFDVLG